MYIFDVNLIFVFFLFLFTQSLDRPRCRLYGTIRHRRDGISLPTWDNWCVIVLTRLADRWDVQSFGHNVRLARSYYFNLANGISKRTRLWLDWSGLILMGRSGFWWSGADVEDVNFAIIWLTPRSTLAHWIIICCPANIIVGTTFVIGPLL